MPSFADGVCRSLSTHWRYGHIVDEYLDVYLRTPDLPKDDTARALVARGRARKSAGQQLFLMASRGSWCPFQTACPADA
jgi:hypothetical protein